MSDIFQNVGQCADDISFIHSRHTDISEHAGAMMMNIGALQPNRPSLGSWLVCRYSGRDYRLTDVSGNVVKDVLA